MKHLVMATLVVVAITSPSWALFESNKELLTYAKINLEDAIRSALKEVPGRAVQADVGKNEGKTVWKIEIINAHNESQTVYVDAETGLATLDK